jgi:hypothetical protein
MGKIGKKKLTKIISENPLVDAALLQQAAQQLKELRALRKNRRSYDLVIPYSKKVMASSDTEF